ncbi:MFS transporter [Nonomuraea jabiensis]|uniref:MFS transporter n=1 Tax=Nonomuraea jabiensis TaxID=882448 RepID=UPI0034326F49
MKGARATNNVLLAQLMASKGVAARALLRSVNNLGVSGGALLGAVALVVNTRRALAAILLADALSFLLALFLFSRLRPTPAAARKQGDKSWAALRDRPFLALTVVNGLMSLQYYVLTLALPLWVVQESSAPDWTFPALLALNTLVVAGGQIRVSRGIHDVPSAVRHLRVAGLVFLGSMALFAVTGWLSGGQAVALLVVAVVLHSVAEIWHASGSFEVSVGLAPAASVGTYQAVYNLGLSGAEAVAPAVVIGCCIGAGTWGWVALGVLFALAGAVTPSVARRAGGNLATT